MRPRDETNAARSPPSAALVIGVGNAYRRDDAVGLWVAQQVQVAAPPGVRVIEASGEGAALLDIWRGAATVVLCDATQSGAAPGTVHRLDAHAHPLAARFFRYSTHAFGVAQALELARALGELPPRVIVYGIEGATFAAGVGLSLLVAQAAQAVVGAMLADLGAPAPPE